MVRALTGVALVSVLSIGFAAQTKPSGQAGAPVPTPRTSDGRPDLSGRWGGGGGGAVTVIRAVAFAVPPSPLAIMVYVVDELGDTEREPLVPTSPIP